MEALISIAMVYVFIVLGFIAKKIFQRQINEQTLILISLYFLQPILTFWGLTRTPINQELLLVPFVYLLIVGIVLLFSIIASQYILKDPKERSIFIAASLIGNTGNLGIPLGIALFGEQSVAYTSIINIANVFFIYTIGVFFYAKGEFSIKQSLMQIVKIPILWFAIFAIAFNAVGIAINPSIDKFLEMGAYATIVTQLMIFGIYLADIKIRTIDYGFCTKITAVKHFILPVVGLAAIWLFKLNPHVSVILLLELSVPLAVNNVNMAALYKCNPTKTTEAILFTTMFFIFAIYFYMQLFEYILN
ncbi:MAG: AEC family transporter [Sulfurovaceae bacterium]|nr:AEC family transporter [Sulfurovaceae bacterium]